MLTHNNNTVRLMPEIVSEKDKDRFWSKVAILHKDKCWEWGGFNNRGYGTFYFKGGLYFSHRVAYYFYYNLDPTDKQVCHKCDNRKCCNPNHLFLGTNKENYLDSVKKNRSVLSPGEKNIVCKLSELQVRALHEECREGNITYSELSKKYSISPASIIAILNGTNWKHLKLDKIKKKECRPESQNATNAKLKNEDVIAIRELYRTTNKTYNQIAEMYNVSPSVIFNVCNNKTWKKLESETSSEPTKKLHRSLKFDISSANEVRKEYALGDTSSRRLAKKYSVTKATILNIINNKTHKICQ